MGWYSHAVHVYNQYSSCAVMLSLSPASGSCTAALFGIDFPGLPFSFFLSPPEMKENEYSQAGVIASTTQRHSLPAVVTHSRLQLW